MGGRRRRTTATRVALVLALATCGLQARPPDTHLRVSGTQFITSDGKAFAWRGITAFRLVEFVAHGREREASAYLAWAAAKKLTIVRVLAMANVLFALPPADGQRALPRLLELAAAHGLYVEVVALADSARIDVNLERQVAAVSAICGQAPNCVLEIANEPAHETQARPLRDPAYVRTLAALVPSAVPVSLGSVETGDGYGRGSYITWHPSRDNWVDSLDAGAELLRRFYKPVVADEPMGAADKDVPGRRDNVAAHFHDAASKLKALGIGATFHYEGGLHARRPTRVELACLDAWLAGLT